MRPNPFENPHLEDIPIYLPGKPISELQRELSIEGEIIKLASNESPYGPSERVKHACIEALKEVELYPDGSSYYLRHALADYHNVPIEEIIVGSGSVELIDLIALAFLSPETELLTSDKTFIMMEISAKKADSKKKIIPVNDGYGYDIPAMIDAVNENTRICYIANPNNPTGTMIGQHEIDLLMSKLHDNVIVVFDEAYNEYVENPPDTMKFLKAGKPVIILRTFSKAYGLAGLRVGYGIGRQDLLLSLDKIRNPFNLNVVAQYAALAALADTEHLHKVTELNRRERSFLEEGFLELGLRYIPSATNFILVEIPTDGKTFYNELLKRGIIVRPMAGQGMPKHLRISIGNREQNIKLLKMLKEIL